MTNFTFRRPLLLVISCLLICVTGCHRSKKIDVQGQVVDNETGKPIPNTKVELKSNFSQIANNYSEEMSAETDVDGNFYFSDLLYRYTSSTSTSVRIRAKNDGYDTTVAYINSPLRFSDGVEIRLQKLRPDELPRGYLNFREAAMEQDEPVLRFSFQNNQLLLVDPAQEADFELHYRFKPEGQLGWNAGLGSTVPGKNGKRQYLSEVTTEGDRITQVFYLETVGYPPRLPDLAALDLHPSCSFEYELLQRSSRGFLRHDFLLKTRSGNYALLHFNGHAINWVYQPNGTHDLWRTRHDNWQWLWF